MSDEVEIDGKTTLCADYWFVVDLRERERVSVRRVMLGVRATLRPEVTATHRRV